MHERLILILLHEREHGLIGDPQGQAAEEALPLEVAGGACSSSLVGRVDAGL